MSNGLPLADVQQARISPEFKTPANDFTPFSRDMLRDAQETISRSPENGREMITELPKYEDPTTSMSSEDKALTDRLLAQIMDKPKSKEPEAVVSQIEKNSTQGKKQQGLWAKIKEIFGNFFKNLFR